MCSCLQGPKLSELVHFLLWELSLSFYIFHRHRVCLVDCVDLICSLYSWWEGFGSSSLATLPLGFNCGIISTTAALLQWELSMKVAQLLGLWGPWWCQVCKDMDCLHRRNYGPIRVSLVVSNSLQPYRLWPAKSLSERGFSSQEYWSVLANTGCHTLLHYISCCRSCQLPWVPGPARIPATQAAAPPLDLAPTEANPSPLGQPQELNCSGWPMCRAKNKNHNWNPGAVWLRKKTQNLPTSCTSCRLNPHDQLSRLCVYGICKRPLRAPTKENAQALIAVNTGGKNTQEQDQIRIWAASTAGPEISTLLEGILGRWGGLWLPVRERTLTAVDSRKTFIILIFWFVL